MTGTSGDSRQSLSSVPTKSATLSRRDLLRRSVALAAAGSAIAIGPGLLAACGSDDDDGPTATASGSGGEVTTTAGGPDPTSGSAGEAQSGGTINIGVNLEPDSLDPAVTPYAVSHMIMMNVFDTLVWRSDAGEFVPGLAEAWDSSDDGLTYTFTLRQDVTFHDGTDFNAVAVQKFLDRVIDPETQSGFAANLIGPYASANVPDDYTIEAVLDAPFAPFLDGLSQAFLGIPSPTAQEADPEAFLRNPVGSGFMKFTEWIEQSHVSLERNEDYSWGPSIFQHTGAAYLESMTFRFLADIPTRLAALEAGDVNCIQALPDSELERMESDNAYVVSKAVAPGVPVVLMINMETPPTDDLAVRQAFITAIDREAIVDIALFGATEPAFGPLWRGTPSYSSEVESYYVFDTAAAAALLEEAGWTEGSDGVREKDGQPLVINWGVVDANAPYAELVQAQLNEAGLDLRLNRTTIAAANEAIINNQSNIISLGWISSDPVILSNLFHSKNLDGGYTARTKVNDPMLDEALDAGETSSDPAERDEAYATAQSTIMDLAIIAPLYGSHQNWCYEAAYQNIGRDFRTYPWLYDTWVQG